LLGEASPWEEQAVKQWITAAPANQQYFDQFKLIWDSSKQFALQSKADENKAWERFQQRVSNGNRQPVPVKTMNFSWMRIAAAIVILAGISLITYIVINKANEPKELVVQAGQTVVNDTLPDGSTITLNKNSLISYPEKFKGNKREVVLKGEAFFKVTPDQDKPFHIYAHEVEITVMGTSFNVKSGIGSTEVIVETGIVRVTKDGKAVELRAGEKTIISSATATQEKEAVTDQLYKYYRTREFVCRGTPLWKLVQVVNEAYNVNIVFGRNELRDLQLNTTFDNESLDQLLNVISLTYTITVTRKDDQIILQ
jgi:transmembrane sensor